VRGLDYLLGKVSSDSDSEEDEEEEERSVTRTFGTRTSSPPLKRQKTSSFGLEDDCPMFEGLGDYVLEVGGASLVAARELRDGRADIAIAWTGGRYVSFTSPSSFADNCMEGITRRGEKLPDFVTSTT
jgi:acetoin utilization deacetylase AcuC-like enzyme